MAVKMIHVRWFLIVVNEFINLTSLLDLDRLIPLLVDRILKLQQIRVDIPSLPEF